MSYALHHHILFSFHLSLHKSVHEMLISSRSACCNSCKHVFKLHPTRRDQRLLKGIMRTFSTNQQHLFNLEKNIENNVYELRDNHEAKEKEHIIQNSWSLEKDVDDNHGNGNKGDGNDNNNGGDDGGDEGEECNKDDITGICIQWWWWWKWRQARSRSENPNSQSHMWPVDVAVQVMENEVMKNIQPAIEAVFLEPIKQYINEEGLFLVLVFGAFFISCIQIVAGFAIMSSGVLLASLASIAVAIVWKPWKKSSSKSQQDNDQDDSSTSLVSAIGGPTL